MNEDGIFSVQEIKANRQNKHKLSGPGKIKIVSAVLNQTDNTLDITFDKKIKMNEHFLTDNDKKGHRYILN